MASVVSCKRSRRLKQETSSRMLTFDEIRDIQQKKKSILRCSRSRSSCHNNHHIVVGPANGGGGGGLRCSSGRVPEAATAGLHRHQKKNTGKRISCRMNRRIRTSCSATEASLRSVGSSTSSTCIMKQTTPPSGAGAGTWAGAAAGSRAGPRCRSATPNACWSWNHSASPSCSYTSVLSSVTSHDLHDNGSAASFKSLTECQISSSWHETDDLNQFRICPRTQTRRVVVEAAPGAADSWAARRMRDNNEWIMDPYNCTSLSDNELYAAASTVPSLRKFRRFRNQLPQKFGKTYAVTTSDERFDDQPPGFDTICSRSNDHTDTTFDCTMGFDHPGPGNPTTDDCSFAAAERYCYDNDDDDEEVRRLCLQRFVDRCSVDADDCILTDDDMRWSPSGLLYDGQIRCPAPNSSWKKPDGVDPCDDCDDGRFDTNRNFGSVFDGTCRSYLWADQCMPYELNELKSCDVDETLKMADEFGKTEDVFADYQRKHSLSCPDVPRGTVSRRTSKVSSTGNEKADRSKEYDDPAYYEGDDQNVKESSYYDSDSRYVGTNHSRYRKSMQTIARPPTCWSSYPSQDDYCGEELCPLSSYRADPMVQNPMTFTTSCQLQLACHKTAPCLKNSTFKPASRELVCSRSPSPSPCMSAAGRPTVDSDFAFNGLDEDCNVLPRYVAVQEDYPECAEPEEDTTPLEAEPESREPVNESLLLEHELDGLERPEMMMMTAEADDGRTEQPDEKTTEERAQKRKPKKPEMETMRKLEAEPESNLSEPNGDELEHATSSSGGDDPQVTVTLRAYMPTPPGMYPAGTEPESCLLVQTSERDNQQLVTSFVVPLYTATSLPPAKYTTSLPSQFTRDDIVDRSTMREEEMMTSDDETPLVPSNREMKDSNLSDFEQEEMNVELPGSVGGGNEAEPLEQQQPRSSLTPSRISELNATLIPSSADSKEEMEQRSKNEKVQAWSARMKPPAVAHQIEGLNALSAIPEHASLSIDSILSERADHADLSDRRSVDRLRIRSRSPSPSARSKRRPKKKTVVDPTAFNETLPVVQDTQGNAAAGLIPSHSSDAARRVRSEEVVDATQVEVEEKEIESSEVRSVNLYERQATGFDQQQQQQQQQTTRIPGPRTSDLRLKPRATTSPVHTIPVSLPPTPTLLLQIEILPRKKNHVVNKSAARRISSGDVFSQTSRIPVPVTTSGTQTSLTFFQLKPDLVRPLKSNIKDPKQTGATKVTKHPQKVSIQTFSPANNGNVEKNLPQNRPGKEKRILSGNKYGNTAPESTAETDDGVSTDGADDDIFLERVVSDIDLFMENDENDYDDKSAQLGSLQTPKVPVNPPGGEKETIETSLDNAKAANATETSASQLKSVTNEKKGASDKDRRRPSDSAASAVTDDDDKSIEFPEAALDCKVCIMRLGLSGSAQDELLEAGENCEVCQRRVTLNEIAKEEKKAARKNLKRLESPKEGNESQQHTEMPAAAADDSQGGLKPTSLTTKSTKKEEKGVKKDLQQPELPKPEKNKKVEQRDLSESAGDSGVGVKPSNLTKSDRKDKIDATKELAAKPTVPRPPGAGGMSSKIPVRTTSSLQRTGATQQPDPSKANKDPGKGLQHSPGAPKSGKDTQKPPHHPASPETSKHTKSQLKEPGTLKVVIDSKRPDKPLRKPGSPESSSDTTKSLDQPGSPEASKHARTEVKAPGTPKVAIDSKRPLRKPGSPVSSSDTTKSLDQPGSPEASKHARTEVKAPGTPKVTVDSKRPDKPLRKPGSPESSSDTTKSLDQPGSPETSKRAKIDPKVPGSSKVVTDPKKVPQQSESPRSVKFDVKKSDSDKSSKDMQQKATDNENTDQKQKKSAAYNDTSGKKAFSEVALRSARGSPAKIANSAMGLMSEPDTLKDVAASKYQKSKGGAGKETGKQAFPSLSSDLSSVAASDVVAKDKEKDKKPKPKDAKQPPPPKAETKGVHKKPGERKHHVKAKLKDDTKTKKKLREPAAKNPSIPKELMKNEASILHNPTALTDDEDVPETHSEDKTPPPQWDAASFGNQSGRAPVKSILKKDKKSKTKKKAGRLKFNEDVEMMFIDDDEYMDDVDVDGSEDDGDDDERRDSYGSDDSNY